MTWRVPEIPKQGLTYLTKRIAEVTGFKESRLRAPLVEAAIRSEMRRSQIEDFPSYSVFLERHPSELQLLVERCMVGETWFFRQNESFHHLQATLRKRFVYGKMEQPLRILSLGCASGEEVYSLIITAEQSGWPFQACEITGIDLHRGSIQRAKEGCYGPNSFRGMDRESYSRYFTSDGLNLCVREELRQAPDWVHGNALDPALWKTLGKFEIIFCRNLLVYLTSDARRRVAGFLYQVLEEGGCLYVGPTDTVELIEQGFSSIGSPRSFAFERGQGVHPLVERISSTSLETAGGLKEDILTAIEDAANRGDLEAAEALFVQVKEKGMEDSCRLSFLLGVIRHAQGRYQDAEASFKKAIESNPSHYESLIYLVLLAENRGDLASAEQWRSRAEQIRLEVGL